MGALLDAVAAFLEGDGWSPEIDTDNGVASAGFAGDNGTWDCFVVAVEDQDRLVAYSVYPARVDESAARAAVVELLTRVNFELLIGSFEIDLGDGEVRFRTSVDVEGTPLSDVLLRNLLYANVTTMDHFLPAIDDVVAGRRSPVDALASVGEEA